MSSNGVVVIGGGQAGFQVCASLRQDGYAERVRLICDEAHAPYQRPPLSKGFLAGKTGLDALPLRTKEFYAENDIELIHDCAAQIQAEARTVELASGSCIAYDHLVLSIGARNRRLSVPNSDANAIEYIRTISDAQNVASLLRDAQHAVVIGAGFIGLEFASIARDLNINVTVLELAHRPMQRAVSAAMSQAFVDYHRSRDVNFLFGEGVESFETDGIRVTKVVTTSGKRLPTDFVVVCVGVVPNTEIAAEAGLKTANGIVVDEHLLTSDPLISAIGDCACFPLAETGRNVRLESVQNATDQARVVSARITGKWQPYVAVPWFWTEQGKYKLQIAGIVDECETFLPIGDTGSGSFSILCFRDGKLACVESLNRPAEHIAARRLLATAANLPSCADAMAPGFALKTWKKSDGDIAA